MALDPSNFGSVSLVPISGEGWRHISTAYDALSGEGARIRGGRFNPPSSFPVLYICRSRPCVVAELERLGTLEGIGLEGLLPRSLYKYEYELEKVLNLTDGSVRDLIGIDRNVLTGPDWTTCREIGVAFHAIGVQGILTPSATGVGEVLAVFVQNIGLGVVSPSFIEDWSTASDIELQS